MAVTTDKYLDLLEQKKAFAHIATLMPDGSPQVTPVWFDYTNGIVRVNTAKGRVKARNLKVGSPVALAIMDPDEPYRYLQVRGRVRRVVEEGADELMVRVGVGSEAAISAVTSLVTEPPALNGPRREIAVLTRAAARPGVRPARISRRSRSASRSCCSSRACARSSSWRVASRSVTGEDARGNGTPVGSLEASRASYSCSRRALAAVVASSAARSIRSAAGSRPPRRRVA